MWWHVVTVAQGFKCCAVPCRYVLICLDPSIVWVRTSRSARGRFVFLIRWEALSSTLLTQTDSLQGMWQSRDSRVSFQMCWSGGIPEQMLQFAQSRKAALSWTACWRRVLTDRVFCSHFSRETVGPCVARMSLWNLTNVWEGWRTSSRCRGCAFPSMRRWQRKIWQYLAIVIAFDLAMDLPFGWLPVRLSLMRCTCLARICLAFGPWCGIYSRIVWIKLDYAELETGIQKEHRGYLLELILIKSRLSAMSSAPASEALDLSCLTTSDIVYK